MKLLVTGKPKSGKSALIHKAVDSIPAKYGFITDEIGQNGQRTGFIMRDHEGRTGVLAKDEDISPYKVSRYSVDVDSLEKMLTPLSSFKNDDFLYIDEIGQMQLYSEHFRQLVDLYLSAPNDFIGTITKVYEDEFTNKIRARKDILIIEIDTDNRNSLTQMVKAAVKNRKSYNKLSAPHQAAVFEYARFYLSKRQYVSLFKLFNNAVPYLVDKKAEQHGDHFIVAGNNGDHEVRRMADGTYMCDCPLFKGEDPFAEAAECSHIQVIKISQGAKPADS